jgi:hypothetical protein
MRDTIEMAEEAGAISYWHLSRLKRFEALVRADEREACAKVCEERDSGQRLPADEEDHECAAAIRNRGNT